MKSKNTILAIVGLAGALTLPHANAFVWDTSNTAGVTLGDSNWSSASGPFNNNWAGTTTGNSGDGTSRSAWSAGAIADFNRTVASNSTITTGGNYTVSVIADVIASAVRYQNNSDRQLTIGGTSSIIIAGTATANATLGTATINDNNTTTAGSFTINAPIQLGADADNFIDVYLSANKTLTINGAVSNFPSVSSGLNVIGSSSGGTLLLTGTTNSYSGGTTIKSGTVQINSVNALGTGDVSFTSATGETARLFINDTSAAFARNLTANGTGNTSILSFLNTSGTATFSGNITLERSMFARTDTATTNATISGKISDGSVGRQLVKSGAGTLLLTSNDNTFGSLAVNEGTVLVNGTVGLGSGTGATNTTTVAVGATLGGNGTILHSVSVNGTLAPGNSIDTINTGSLTIQSAGALDIELGRSGLTPVSDRTNVTGTVTLDSGADLKLTLYTGLTDPVLNDIFFLVSNDGADAVSGVFTKLNGVTTTLTEGSTFAWNSQEFKITYQADFGTSSFTGGNDIALQVVPEPSTWALLAGSLTALVIFRKRRRLS